MSSISYNVELDRDALREAISLFEFVGGNSADALRVAINKAGPKVRTIASRAIRSQVNLKAAYVNERLTFKRATRADLSGAIKTTARGLLLSRYSTDTAAHGYGSVPKVPPLGIRVKIKPGSAPKIVTGDAETVGKPFYMVLKDSDAIGIVARLKNPGPNGGKIKAFYGPSLSQVFNTVRDDVLPAARDELQKQLLDAMRYLLVKQYPPEA